MLAARTKFNFPPSLLKVSRTRGCPSLYLTNALFWIDLQIVIKWLHITLHLVHCDCCTWPASLHPRLYDFVLLRNHKLQYIHINGAAWRSQGQHFCCPAAPYVWQLGHWHCEAVCQFGHAFPIFIFWRCCLEFTGCPGKFGGSASQSLGWSACIPKDSSIQGGQVVHIFCMVLSSRPIAF